MKGIFTILDHKKWVFAWTVFITSTYLLTHGKTIADAYHPYLDVAHYAMIMGALITFTLSASSFDKSQWRDK